MSDRIKISIPYIKFTVAANHLGLLSLSIPLRIFSKHVHICTFTNTFEHADDSDRCTDELNAIDIL